MTNNNIVKDYSSQILTIFQEVVKTYEMNLEIIKQSEEELNDLNHEIELSSSKDMYKGYLLYKEIREVRIRRRDAKNQNELLKDMYDFFTGQQGQSFKSKIQSIQGNSVNIKKIQDNRTYTPRQRSDLTITNQQPIANKPFENMLSEFNKNKAHMKNGKLRK